MPALFHFVPTGAAPYPGKAAPAAMSKIMGSWRSPYCVFTRSMSSSVDELCRTAASNAAT